MSPAGAGAVRYIPKPHRRLAWMILVTAGLLSILFVMSRGSAAHASTRPVVAALPGWAQFQSDCTAGPAPGQGSTPQACVCWEGNLQAEAIQPAYAVDALNAAQVGGGAAYTVGENLPGGPVGDAMAGCGLYVQ